MGEFIRLEVEDGVGTIRLDRPPANAIDEQVGNELAAAAREAGSRDDVGAVVVWGGPKIFAAGADIKAMAGLGPQAVRPFASALGDALELIEALPIVTISAINGFALGGGCELALATDLRYAASDAVLGQPEIRIGVMPGAGGTQRLPRIVGPARATELILSGRQIDAVESDQIGLVTRVLPPGRVYEKASQDAAWYARGPGAAIAAVKASLALARTDDRAGYAAERDAFCALFATEDQQEGMRAFLDKREPEFRGR